MPAPTISDTIFLLVAIKQSLVFGSILNTMALEKGSDSYATWLNPPVQSQIEISAFHVTNPDQVAQGVKPNLMEVGPFIYKIYTVKNSRDNLEFNDDGETLTYRPRKFYHLDREISIGDPDTTFITVPNIPLWNAFNQIKMDSGFIKGIKAGVILNNGLGTPFINVSFTGLLWGYEDDLQCIGANKASDCPVIKNFAYEDEYDDDFLYDDYDNDWNDDWKRKKRSITDEELSFCPLCTADWPENYEKLLRSNPEYVNCRCMWGLFRGVNVTLRKPVKMYHGISDLSKRGLIKEFDGEPTMGVWKEGSQCDKIGGQVDGTLPPNVYKEGGEMDIFISPCHKIKLSYLEKVDHSGIETLRFVAKASALGSHDDPDDKRRNPENECYCMKEEGFTCFKSGVYDQGPCYKIPFGYPIAISAPHFYQADPSFREAVVGMKPDKEKHQFYVDVVPELGIPLAIQSRTQLNAILRSDPDIAIIANFPKETVFPILWVQEGYSNPSKSMVDAVRVEA